MNWNEFRFKWFVFVVFILCAMIIVTGCSTNTPEPTHIEPAPYRDLEGLPPCELPHRVIEGTKIEDCEQRLIA